MQTSQICAQGCNWREEAYGFVEAGHRTASEIQGVVAGFRTGSWQVHLWATVIWCRDSREGERGMQKRRSKKSWFKKVVLYCDFKMCWKPTLKQKLSSTVSGKQDVAHREHSRWANSFNSKGFWQIVFVSYEFSLHSNEWLVLYSHLYQRFKDWRGWRASVCLLLFMYL